jgi:hypothetical protein
MELPMAWRITGRSGRGQFKPDVAGSQHGKTVRKNAAKAPQSGMKMQLIFSVKVL